MTTSSAAADIIVNSRLVKVMKISIFIDWPYQLELMHQLSQVIWLVGYLPRRLWLIIALLCCMHSSMLSHMMGIYWWMRDVLLPRLSLICFHSYGLPLCPWVVQLEMTVLITANSLMLGCLFPSRPTRPIWLQLLAVPSSLLRKCLPETLLCCIPRRLLPLPPEAHPFLSLESHSLPQYLNNDIILKPTFPEASQVRVYLPNATLLVFLPPTLIKTAIVP